RSSLVPIAGRRCACPAYISAQGECRPGKAQPPPGIEAGEALGWAGLGWAGLGCACPGDRMWRG
ncbi:hypothetical protein ACS0S5_01790, partial [Klebsiella pneumoniae]|uniref:hypothetical protein n=1 Tax=Klebsiella pneumoniae TaxID=573 RepID=UPI003EC56379